MLLMLQVYDSGAPDETNTTTVDVRVNRNSVCPSFTDTSYIIRDVWETTPVGTVLATITANDTDAVSNITLIITLAVDPTAS